MNEHDMTDLLERAGARLEPDVVALVAAGTSRGRSRRRRRRAAGGATAVLAAVALVGTLLGVTGGSDVAETVPVAPQPIERTRPVTSAELPETFASVVPGSIEELPASRKGRTKPGSSVAEFRWNGFLVLVSLMAPDYFRGEPETGGPLRSCQHYGQYGTECRPLPDGTVVQTVSFDLARGAKESYALAFFPDGWTATASIRSTATDGGAPLADEAPLTPEQLLDAMRSDAWFE